MEHLVRKRHPLFKTGEVEEGEEKE